jgi:PilZ domain
MGQKAGYREPRPKRLDIVKILAILIQMKKTTKGTKTKFLLFTPEREGSEELIKEIEKNGIGKVERASSMDLARTQVVSGEIQCLILNLRSFRFEDVKLVELFYSLNKDITVIVVSRQIEEKAYSRVKDLRYVIVLQRPFREAKIIALFCKKLTTSRENFRREHFRYQADQPASMEMLSNGKTYQGKVVSISRGGAVFESGQDLSLIEHELLRLSIQLTEISKIHLVNAEIVWILKFDSKINKMSVGLKFINPKEVPDSILK